MINFYKKFGIDLTLGMKGSEVTELQTALMIEKCFYDKVFGDISPTGNFGGITVASVKRFQAKYGIPATGNVLAMTRAKLNEIFAKRTISDAGVQAISVYEGFSATPYVDSVGVWTIGFGTTVINGRKVSASTPIVSREYATELLKEHIREKCEPLISAGITTYLTQNQYDALCSFLYNLGSLRDLKEKINKGIIQKSDWLAYNKGRIGGVLKELKGLSVRRAKEWEMWIAK